MAWIKETLNVLDVRPSKGRGQNFLQSSHDAERLIKAAKISLSDEVVEIGPGLGALTQILVDQCEKLTVVEIESKFIEYLSQKLAGKDINYIDSDFRKLQLESIFRNKKLKIVTNLPYVFSTEAILWLIENRKFVQSAALLVQKEFAERLAAPPNSKTYGSISIHTQYYYGVELGVEIGGDAFYPKAGVPSQQILLTPQNYDFGLKCPEDFFEKVVRAAFSMRRKKLTNCISSKFEDLSKTVLFDIFNELGLDFNIRAENLSVSQFCELANALFSFSSSSEKAIK